MRDLEAYVARVAVRPAFETAITMRAGGSPQIPSIARAMMLRWISLVPPRIVTARS
jgi:hypothetical protein